MARARNIKPGFFKNEELAEVDPLGRILFAGLWCLADREGRLEDRPRRIKAEILPYDDCDAGQLLDQLSEHGFILRYEVDGKRYIQILKFDRHQNPHRGEKPSKIPAPQGFEAEEVPGAHDAGPEEERTSTVQAPNENPSYRADSHDSLIPDSCNPEKTTGPDGPVVGSGAPPTCPHQEIIDLYHQRLPMLPRVRVWDSDRQRILRARWKEKPERQDLGWWERFFNYVAGCPFLVGQCEGRGGSPPFQADLEWLIRPKNFRKVIEGRYEQREAA